MPQAVAGISAFFAANAGAAAIAKFILYAAVSYGISKILTKVPAQDRGSKIETDRNSAAARRFILGETRTAGVFCYYGSSGIENKFFHMVMMLAGHECDSVTTVYFNDQIVSFDGNDLADSFPYAGLARVQFFNGGDNQVAPADLVSDTAGQSRGQWSSTDRLRGIAHLYARLEYDEVYEERIPSVSCIVRGAKMYDPRKDSTEGGSGSHRKDLPSTWEWSANPALCLAWYLTYPAERGGRGMSWSKVDIGALVTAANICDEVVDGKPRYTCNGIVDTGMKPGEIIQQIATSMAGGIIWPEGVANIYAGTYVAPTVTIDEDDLISDITIVTSRPIADSFNEVAAAYIEPTARHALVDMPPVRDETLFDVSAFNDATNVITLTATHNLTEGDRVQFRPVVAGNTLPTGLIVSEWYYVRNPSGADLQVALAEGGTPVAFTGAASGAFQLAFDRGLTTDGRRYSKNIKLDMVEDVDQAQRLASIELRRNRQAIACQLMCNIEALQLLPNDTVRVLLQRYGWWDIIPATNQAITANVSTDRLTCATAPANGTAIVIDSDDALPTPLQPDTIYYVRNRTSTDFQVSRSRGGPIINITNAASAGNHYFDEVQGREFEVIGIKQSWDGDPPTPVVALDLVSTDSTVWTAPPAVGLSSFDLLNVPGPLDDLVQRTLAPVITWVDPATDFFDFTSGGSFDLEVDVTDASGDLISLRIDLIDATTGALVAAITNQIFAPTAARNFANPTNTHGGGTYQIIVTATDERGNVTVAKRTVTNTTGGVLLPPVLDPALADFVGNIDIDITVSGIADRIQWATTAVGGAEPTTGITTVVATSTTVNLTSSRRLWARSGDGVDVSAWVFADYYRVGSL